MLPLQTMCSAGTTTLLGTLIMSCGPTCATRSFPGQRKRRASKHWHAKASDRRNSEGVRCRVFWKRALWEIRCQNWKSHCYFSASGWNDLALNLTSKEEARWSGTRSRREYLDIFTHERLATLVIGTATAQNLRGAVVHRVQIMLCCHHNGRCH